MATWRSTRGVWRRLRGFEAARQLCARADAELAVDARQVTLDRPVAQVEDGRYLLVRPPAATSSAIRRSAGVSSSGDAGRPPTVQFAGFVRPRSPRPGARTRRAPRRASPAHPSAGWRAVGSCPGRAASSLARTASGRAHARRVLAPGVPASRRFSMRGCENPRQRATAARARLGRASERAPRTSRAPPPPRPLGRAPPGLRPRPARTGRSPARPPRLRTGVHESDQEPAPPRRRVRARARARRAPTRRERRPAEAELVGELQRSSCVSPGLLLQPLGGTHERAY